MLKSNSSGTKQNQAQRAGWGWSCAPDGVFGTRLPICSFLTMAQHSYSKMHTNKPETRHTVPVVPFRGSGRTAAVALCRCLSLDTCLLVF